MQAQEVVLVLVLSLSVVSCARLLPHEDPFAWQLVEKGVRTSQNTSTPSAIANTAYAFLVNHSMIGEKWGMPFHYYKPSTEKYGPYQWLWDSSSHMIVWSHRNVSNSIADMRTMLQMQQPNGRIPEIIFWGYQSPEDIALVEAQYSSSHFVDLTQMPVLPYSLRAIFNQTHDVALLKELVPKLVKYFDWWRTTRDADGDYLVSIFHGWESGLDASPIYDPAYGIPKSNTHPTYLELYPHFTELVIWYKWMYNWNQTEILACKHRPLPDIDGYFVVQDVGVNAVYASGWGVLSDLASNFDQNLSAICKRNQLNAEKAIITKLWSKNLNRFVSTYKDKSGNTVVVDYETVQSLFPLLLETLPVSYQLSIVNTQLKNTSKFWLQYPVPSVSASAAQFTPDFTVDLMWRGPTWPIETWFVMEGMHKHNIFNDTIEALMDRWIALYQKSGIWEQYNPITGENYGVEGLGMSTLIVDWLYRLGRV